MKGENGCFNNLNIKKKKTLPKKMYLYIVVSLLK